MSPLPRRRNENRRERQIKIEQQRHSEILCRLVKVNLVKINRIAFDEQNMTANRKDDQNRSMLVRHREAADNQTVVVKVSICPLNRRSITLHDFRLGLTS